MLSSHTFNSVSTQWSGSRHLVILVISLIAAFFVSHWSAPVGYVPTKNPYLTHWIVPPTTEITNNRSARGYYRQELSLNAIPKSAWITIASEDYALYINGTLVAANKHLINYSYAVTQKLSDKLQSISRGQAFHLPRAPELKKNHNIEEKISQFYDVTPFLKTGKNVISLYLQSVAINRFSIYGEIDVGVPEKVVISGAPEDWKYNGSPDASPDLRWNHNEYDASYWKSTEFGGYIKQPRYTLLPHTVWTSPFDDLALTFPIIEGGGYIRVPIDSVKEAQVKREYNQHMRHNNWLKIDSNYPYSLFIDDVLVGSGVPDQVDVFNLNLYKHMDVRYIYLCFRETLNVRGITPEVKVAGEINGRHISIKGDQFQKLSRYDSNWNDGEGDWVSSATIVNPYRPALISKVLQPQVTSYWVKSIFIIWSVLISLFYITLFIVKIVRNIQLTVRGPVKEFLYVSGCGALLTLVVMSVLELLRFRFQESDSLLYYINTLSNDLWIYAPISVMLFSTLFLLFPYGYVGQSIRQYTPTRLNLFHSDFAWMVAILALGFYLRTQGLGQIQLQADENVSWDAAIGILREGVPEAVSGVWYTRSPLYHYLLAGWLKLFGNDIVVARSYSTLYGLGVVVLAYFITLNITSKRYVALIAALVVAVDPWQTQVSGVIRFYQQMQFFCLLSILFFIKGFIEGCDKRYQNLFFVACMCAVLSQEVFVTAFPALSIAFVFFYRNFSWKKDLNLIIGFVTVLLCSIFDIFVFTALCLTPHVGVATTSDSIMQLHLAYLDLFATGFLVGNNRAHVLFSFFFIFGFFYWFKPENKKILFLYLVVILTIITCTVLVMQIANRYLFSIFPLLIILSVITICALIDRVVAWCNRLERSSSFRFILKDRVRVVLYGLFFIALIVNCEPNKYRLSFEPGTFIDHLQALEELKKIKQDGDKIMAAHPMPAAIVFKGIDYYLMESIYFDELYMRDNVPKDRWAGGELVSKVDKIRDVFLKNERVWILIDEFELRKISNKMAHFIEGSTVNVKEFFGVKLLLWDKSHGKLVLQPDQGGAYHKY